MDVVEEDDQRAARGQLLEQLAHRPEGLLDAGRHTGEPEQRGQAFPDEGRVVTGLEQPQDLGPRLIRRVHVAHARRVAQHLDDGPEGDPLAVRKTASGDDPRTASQPGQELHGQPGLPDAGCTEHRNQLARSFLDRSRERLIQRVELRVPAHKRRVEPPAPTRKAGSHFQEAPCHDRLALALDGEGREGVGLHRVPDQVVGGLADQDLARFGGLLEPGRQVYRVPDHEGFTAVGVARDDLPGVHAGPGQDAHAPRPFELFIELVERVTHLERRSDRSKGVVLVQPRYAEHRHDGVPDELLGGAAVALEDRLHLLEVPPHEPAQRLGIERLAEHRGAGDIREEDGHDLSGFACVDVIGHGVCHSADRAVATARKGRHEGPLDNDKEISIGGTPRPEKRGGERWVEGDGDPVHALRPALRTPAFRGSFARNPLDALRDVGVNPQDIDAEVLNVLTELTSAELRVLADVGGALRKAGVDAGVALRMV